MPISGTVLDSENRIARMDFKLAVEISKLTHMIAYTHEVDENAFSEASLVAAFFPEGILCMETALLYYDYTDRTPDEWHIAVAIWL